MRDQDSGGNDYWYVPAVNLATYADSQGFTAWHFDTENGQPNEAVPVLPTGYDTLRNFSDGERRQVSSYFDTVANEQRYETIRYVDLRLPNELAS